MSLCYLEEIASECDTYNVDIHNVFDEANAKQEIITICKLDVVPIDFQS